MGAVIAAEIAQAMAHRAAMSAAGDPAAQNRVSRRRPAAAAQGGEAGGPARAGGGQPPGGAAATLASSGAAPPGQPPQPQPGRMILRHHFVPFSAAAPAGAAAAPQAAGAPPRARPCAGQPPADEQNARRAEGEFSLFPFVVLPNDANAQEMPEAFRHFFSQPIPPPPGAAAPGGEPHPAAHTLSQLFTDIMQQLFEAHQARQPSPASDAQLQQLLNVHEGTVQALAAGQEVLTCPICLEDMVTGEQRVKMPCCGNSFHRWCCVRWLGKESCRCPVCRQPLPEAPPPSSSSDSAQDPGNSAATSSDGSNGSEESRPDRAGPVAAPPPAPPRLPLTSQSVADLKRLCHSRGLDASNCLEKKDLLALLNAAPAAAAPAAAQEAKADGAPMDESGLREACPGEAPSPLGTAADPCSESAVGAAAAVGATASSSQQHLSSASGPARRQRSEDGDDDPGGKAKIRRVG